MTTGWRTDYRELLAEHVAEDELAEALVVAPVRWIEPAAEVERRRERLALATATAHDIIDRERRGVAERPLFRGALAALRALDEVRMDGAGIKSTSDPARFEVAGWTMSSTGGGDGAQRAVERIAPVARAWDLCLAAGWVVTTYPATVRLSPAQARAVVVWATLGVPGDFRPLQHPRALVGEGARPAVTAGHKPLRLATRGRPREDGEGVDRFDDPSPAEVAAYTCAQTGVDVPVGHVVLLRRTGVLELYTRLSQSGLVPLDRRMAKMATETIEPFDLHGWKEIAACLGVDERTAQRWQRDDLPTYDYKGAVVARKTELRTWQATQMKPRRSAP